MNPQPSSSSRSSSSSSHYKRKEALLSAVRTRSDSESSDERWDDVITGRSSSRRVGGSPPPHHTHTHTHVNLLHHQLTDHHSQLPFQTGQTTECCVRHINTSTYKYLNIYSSDMIKMLFDFISWGQKASDVRPSSGARKRKKRARLRRDFREHDDVRHAHD